MQTELITLKEYCALAGYSYKSNSVQKVLKEGNLMVGMVSVSKFGKSYMIEVLKSWKDGKSN